MKAATVTVALVYTRVSSEEQEREGLSLAAQLADCRRYIAAQGWAIAGERQDVMSGKRDDRPQYQALLADVRRLRREGQHVAVVVKWLHRLGRRVLERARSWEELDGLGVRVHSVAEGGLVPKLVADVLAAVAEEESRQIGERVSSTWRHVTSLGWAKVGRVPWGYRLRPATPEERAGGSPVSVLEVDPDTAPFVVEAFHRFGAGETCSSVVRWAMNLPEPARGGRLLGRRTFTDLWRSPVYIARNVNGDPDALARPLAKWPPLVPERVWLSVQQRLDSHRQLPHQASGRFLLTGLMRCPRCEGRMIGQSANRLMPKPRYRCVTYGRDVLCTQTADLAYLDKLVLGELSALVDGIASNPTVQALARRAWQRLQASEASDASSTAHQLESQVQRARERIRRGTEMFVDGRIGQQAYDDLVAHARADVSDAETELHAQVVQRRISEVTLPPLEEVLGRAQDWALVLQGADVAAQRKVVCEFIEQLTPRRVRVGEYRADITWTPLGQALRASAEVVDG